MFIKGDIAMISVKVKEVQEQSIILEIIKPVETSQYRNLSSVALVEIPLDDIATLIKDIKSHLDIADQKVKDKKLRAFEIIKEKGINVAYFQNFIKHNGKYKDSVYDYENILTQEEFDLLKEVLL